MQALDVAIIAEMEKKTNERSNSFSEKEAHPPWNKIFPLTVRAQQHNVVRFKAAHRCVVVFLSFVRTAIATAT